VTVQHVILFNPELNSGNPLSSIIFENSTGYPLEGGSIAINNGTTLLGEAEILQMKPKDQTLVPYAVELGIEIAVHSNVSRLPLKRLTIKKGTISFYKTRKQRTIYRIFNKPKKEMKMFLDHLFFGYLVVSPYRRTN